MEALIEVPEEERGAGASAPAPSDTDRDVVKPGFGLPPRTDAPSDSGEVRRPRGRPKGSKNKPKDDQPISVPARGTSLKKSLQDTITLIGVGVSVANKYDGAVILKGAEGLAKNLDHLANENPAVKRALESMLTASAWGAVITSGATIAIPIACNHRLAPPTLAPLFGCPIPDIEGRAERTE
jgi:hypothetical protein